MASNVDRGDVIRGQCLADNCACEEFELDDKSQFCGYCDDAPTKHKRIGKRVSQSKPACIGNNNETTFTSENQPRKSHTPDAVETLNAIQFHIRAPHSPSSAFSTTFSTAFGSTFNVSFCNWVIDYFWKISMLFHKSTH